MKSSKSFYHGIISFAFSSLIVFNCNAQTNTTTLTTTNVKGCIKIDSAAVINGRITANDTIRTTKDMIIDQNLRVNGSTEISNNLLVGKNISLGAPNDFVSFGYTPSTTSSPAILKFFSPSSNVTNPSGSPNSPDPTPNVACVSGLNYVNAFSNAISVVQSIPGAGGNIVLGHTGSKAFIETQGTGSGGSGHPGDLLINSTCNRNVMFFNHSSTFAPNVTGVVSISGKVGVRSNMQIGAAGTNFTDNNSRLYVLADAASVSNGIKIRHSVPQGGTYGIKLIEQVDTDKAFAIFKTVNTTTDGTERFSVQGDGKTLITTTNADAFFIADANNSNQVNFKIKNDGGTEISNAIPSLKALTVKNIGEDFLVYGNGQTHVSSNMQLGFNVSTIQDPFSRLHINVNTTPSNPNVNTGIKFNTTNNTAKLILVNNPSFIAPPFIVYGDGRTQIGIKKPLASGVHSNAMLSVDGKVIATSFYVTISGSVWADYVFNKDYKLMKLNDLEDYVKINKHLPNIPTAAEVEANGVNVAETNARLLEKIEEAHLYIIELNKKIEELEKRIPNK